jgi:hypothetical protein
MLLTRSETHRKNGVTVISDTGIFFHFSRIDDLIKHEEMIFSTVSNRVKIICAYNNNDYAHLNDEQKQLLQSRHDNKLSIRLSTAQNSGNIAIVVKTIGKDLQIQIIHNLPIHQRRD